MKIKVGQFEGDVPFGYEDLTRARYAYSVCPFKGPRVALHILRQLGYMPSNSRGLKALMWIKAVTEPEVMVQLKTQWTRLKAR